MNLDQLNAFLSTPTVQVVLQIIVALLIFIATLIVSRLLPALLRRLTRLTIGPKTRLSSLVGEYENRVVDSMLPALRIIVLISGIALALITLPLPSGIADGIARVRDIVVTAMSFVIIYHLVSIAIDGTRNYTRTRPTFNETVLFFGKQLSQAVVIAFGITAVMRELGLDVSALLTGLGLGGLAVALAAQDIIANLIGYFVIIGDAPFRVGDVIITDNLTGIVESVSFRSTRLRSLDRPLIIIPNKDITTGSITNLTQSAQVASSGSHAFDQSIFLDLNIPPETVLAAINNLRATLGKHPKIHANTLLVDLVEIAEKGLKVHIVCNFDVPGWNDFQQVRQDVNLIILGVLHYHHISLAAAASTVVLETESGGPTALPSTHSPVPVSPKQA